MASVVKQADAVDGLLVRAQEVTADAAGDAAAIFLGTLANSWFARVWRPCWSWSRCSPSCARPHAEALRYVHAGWILALVASGITWAIASYAISISGAGRELTEGLSSLFAAFVLLGVGLWMHRRASAVAGRRT
ncbi:hypothetical protein [Rhodanobacter lindaniclasticus]